MKLLLLIFVFMTQTNFHIVEKDLLSYRKLFEESASSSVSANNFYQSTRKINNESSPILIGFKAMSELMMCNHVFSPISKLSYFNSGKKLLEEAIKKDSKNIELRFFRFSTQSNAPSLLNYASNLNEDKNLLLTFLKYNSIVTDKDLYNRIRNFMLKSSLLSAEEKNNVLSL